MSTVRNIADVLVCRAAQGEGTLRSRPALSSPMPRDYRNRPLPTSYVRLVLNSLDVGYLRVDANYIITDANPRAVQWLGLELPRVIGSRFSDIVPRSPMQMLSNAVEDKMFFDRKYTSFTRPDRALDLHVYPFEDGAIIFFQDITKPRRQEWSAARHDVLRTALDSIAAPVVVFDDDGVIVACNMAWRAFSREHGLGAERGAAIDEPVLQRERRVRISEGARVRQAFQDMLGGQLRPAQFEYSRTRGGRIEWFRLSATPFSFTGRRFFVGVGEEITAEKEAEGRDARMWEKALALQEDDRQRIAQELHDSTAQHMTAVALSLAKLKGTIGSRAERCLIEEIEQPLSEALRELRTFTYLLYPPLLSEHGFRSTLRRYAAGYTGRTGIPVEMRIQTDELRISKSVQQCVLRVVQEALGNVHRHSGATGARIVLRAHAGHLHLMVSDNGHGFRSGQQSNGVGLPGITARVCRLGGQLKIRSSTGGTRLRATIPLSSSGDD